MALDKTIDQLNENQERTNEELVLLRLQFTELAKEMKSDRLKFIELMREMQSQNETDDSTTNNTDDTSEARDAQKEGNSTLKSILVGILALGAAFSLFSKEFPSLRKALVDLLGGSDPSKPVTSISEIPTPQVPALVAREAINRGTPLVLRSARNVIENTAVKAAVSDNVIASRAGQEAIGAITRADRVIERGKETLSRITPDKETVATAVEKIAGKTAAKAVGKNIPVVGAGVGLIFGAERAIAGDYPGAVKEVASGVMGGSILASAGNVAISADLMLQDVYNEIYGTPEKPLPYETDRIVQNDVWQKNVAQIKPLIENELNRRLEENKEKNKEQQSRAFSSISTTGMPTMSMSRKTEPEIIAPTPAGMNLINDAMSGNLEQFMPTVTPVPQASTVQQASAIVEKQTQESVASAATPQTIVFNDQSNNSKTAVSSGGGASVQQMASSPINRASHNVDAYAIKV